MNCLYIVAAKDGDYCGVYDYTNKLVESINLLGINAHIQSVDSWSFDSLLKLRKNLSKTNYDVIHIQYPSLGMGNSFSFALAPFIFRKSKLFLTLHEFSIFGLFRKLYCFTYTLFAKGIIFSNNWEAQKFVRFYSKNNNIAVLPIGTNIFPSNKISTNLKKEFFLVYFGQIAEGKGLIEFLDTVAILKSRGWNEKVLIMGAYKRRDLFFNTIIERSKQLNIEVKLNLSEREISDFLTTAKFALLPFPDGLSEKRGSALACLLHGTYLISKITEKTPEWLKSITIPYTTTFETANLIGSEDLSLPPIEKVIEEVSNQCNWNSIAKKHLDFYTK